MNCGCEAPTRTGLLDLFDARTRMIAAAKPIAGVEWLPLDEAGGRVLAEPVRARRDMPGVDNSAMDGYALRLADLAATGGALPVVQRIPAGAGVQCLAEGGCARIFTGAPLPRGADAVVPQEHTRVDAAGRVHFPAEVPAGGNIRRRGEELRAGEALLEAGAVLSPAAVALLAGQGIDTVPVRRRLRVALISTGDELIEPGQAWTPGAVYNSNGAMLRQLLVAQGCECLELGVVVDTPRALAQAFLRAREAADLVLCTGGVSVGEEDHVRPVLETLGGLDFHGVAIKPGKPFALGYLGTCREAGTPLIGLPGNPVASLVGWQLLALPFVHGRQGRTPAPLQHFPVTAGFSRRAPRGRRELLRVVLDWIGGDPVAFLAGGQGSHMLGAARQAHGYLMIDPDTPVEEGHAYAYCPGAQFLD
ncbi:gephyrin-like molybdotransferase Glp [Halomonas sp. M4R1S46]|uniref:molybdopterin molybdotransferase MoeA n=1 Tax=Halomonas sp. M4R1S46 TaxID=2982692 RepID=UPI0021E4E33A|nr:gephyrin-like molybdotransferase Glp [Halomonas sp. M4R1S46]UYG07637.1 molybdopterin molybdotransferase MoeA [Halomonas sp. M4R1S46]